MRVIVDKKGQSCLSNNRALTVPCLCTLVRVNTILFYLVSYSVVSDDSLTRITYRVISYRYNAFFQIRFVDWLFLFF